MEVENKNMGTLGERVSRIEGKVEEMSKRLDDMNMRIDDMNVRIDDMNGRIGEMNSRLNNLNDGQHMIRKEMNEMIGGLKDSLTAKIDSNFKWLVGIILGTVLPMWITIIVTIVRKK